jgi:hypothetical protein
MDERSMSHAGRSLHSGKDTVPIVQLLEVTQGRTGQFREVLPPSGIDHRTVHPVTSRYTDYTTRSTQKGIDSTKFHNSSVRQNYRHFEIPL